MNQASDLSESKSTAPPLVYLLQAETGIEKRILEQWIKANAPEGAEFITIAFPRQQSSIVPPELGPRLARRDDPLLSPVRVAWLPKLRQGRRDITLSDLLLTGDPRQPRTYAKHLIAKHQPQRYRVLTGEPATLSSLREIWNRQAGESMDPDSFSAFIVRRATLSLEREESQLLGPQYKMPRLVKEDIKASARFREGLAREAERAGVPMARAEELAEAALSELASGYTPLGVDINRSMGRLFYKQAYDDQIDYDLDQVEQLRDVFKHNPGVVLPSHRTNLDAGVMANAFHELQLPKTSTLGGINMAFFPMGFFFRRSGIIFIRRNTGKDAKRDPLYRWILKEYLGYILEKGFSLEWYIEGTRSRTGKSMPAKLGLLKYAVEAYRDGRIRDLSLIPASMSYDYLNDVHDYAAEAVGATKSPEDFRWYLRWFRSLRGQAYGKIYVRFGTPVSVAAALGTPEQARALDAKEFSLALHKLAFEVSWRINQVTPMTSTSLIAMTLLSAFNQALSLPQLCMLLRSFVEYADARALPLTDNARELLTEDGVRDQLSLMVQRNLVHAETDGPESVYAIGPNQHIVASFFRNSIIHHFLVPAISELALMAASKAEPGKMLDTFWDTAFQLRDTLKFDFFFLEKTQFRESVSEHMFLTSSDWSAQLENEQNDLTEIISTIDPLTAESVLRSFIESYWVVGHCLQLRPDLAQTSKKDFIRFCAGTARQYLMQRRLRNPETGSMLLYQAGLELAINRGLVANADGIEQKRDAFTAEMRHLLDLIDEIHLIGRRAFNQRLQQGNL